MSDREAQLRARLAAVPGEAETIRELAELVGAARNRKDEAVKLWERYAGLVDAVRTEAALLALARAQIEARCEDAAIETLQRCAARTPESFEAFDLLGELLRRDGRLEEAAQALRRAAELDPKAVRPRLALVTCLDGLGQSAEAQAALDEVRRLASGDPAVLALVQELMRRRG